jgi:hypothetical protein
VKRLAFGLVSLAMSAVGPAAAAAPATYRLDLFHTGGKGIEIRDCIVFTRNHVPFCRVCESAREQVIDSIVPGTARL